MKYTKLNKLFTYDKVLSLGLENKKALIMSLFLFLTGISAGIFLELTMSPDEKNIVAQYLQQYLYTGDTTSSLNTPLPSSLANNLFVLFVIFLSGLSSIGFPIAFVALLYKGLALGFCTGLIIETLELKGAAVIATAVLPQNMLIIPALILSVSAACHYALTSISRRRGGVKKSLKESSSSYIYCTIFMAFLILLGCLLEAALYPIVL